MKTRLAAVRHRRQRCPAPRGLRCGQRNRPRGGIRFRPVAAPRGLRNDLRCRRQHPAGRHPGVGRGLPEDQPRRHHQLRPQRLGRRAHPVHRGRRRLRRQRRLPQGRRGHQGRSRAAAATSSRCRSTSRRSRSSTTCQGVTTCSSRRPRSPKIFAGKITTWNDPAIAADNPGVNAARHRRSPRCTAATSPAPPRTSPTTCPARPRPTGRHPVADTWPIQGGEAAQGTSGVIGAVKGGKGTIGYADESQAGAWAMRQGQGRRRLRRARAPRAPRRSSKPRSASSDGGDKAFAFKLDRATTAAGAYPVTLVSYAIACAKYTDAAKADLVKGVPRLRDERRRAGRRGERGGLGPAARPAGLADHARGPVDHRRRVRPAGPGRRAGRSSSS